MTIRLEQDDMPELMILPPADKGFSYNIAPDNNVLIIGRSDSNDLVLSDHLVSRTHARIQRTDNKYTITDLNSYNGVFLNGVKIEKKLLEHRDRITVGSTTLIFIDETDSLDTSFDKDASSREILISMKSDSDVEYETVSFKVEPASEEWKPSFQSKQDKSSKILYVLYQISNKLNRTSDFDELLSTIMDLIFEVIDADYGFVAVTGDIPDQLIPKAIKYKTEPDGNSRALRLSRTIMKKVIDEKLSVLTSDAMDDPQLDGARSIIIQNIRSALSVPLWRKDEVIGMIQLNSFRFESQFIRSDLDLLSTISSQIAMIIEQANLNEKICMEQKQAVENLEKKVEERTKELNKALVKVKSANRQMTASIRYARNIQVSLLPNPEEIKTNLPNSFFLWMPRDIVSGDIFYIDFFDDSFILAVVDCTGHGIPGAFMTMIASSGLRRIIKDEGETDPSTILKQLNFFVKTSLQQDMDYSLSDDGLDAAICLVTKKKLTFAGARLPVVYAMDNKAEMIKGDRKSIGYKRSNLNFDFTSHNIDIVDGMSFYLYTDGFIDQPGGEKRRSMGRKKFMAMIEACSEKPFDEQKEFLLSAFKEHRKENEVVDDITVVGFKPEF